MNSAGEQGQAGSAIIPVYIYMPTSSVVLKQT